MNIQELLEQIRTIGKEYPAAYEFAMKEEPPDYVLMEDMECVCDECIKKHAEDFSKLIDE
jgi:hypothetical protein